MKPNPTIGTCPCPVAGCALQMNVKRMASRATTGTARKGGTLYGDCPDHGRFGFDGAQKMQDYISENSKKCDANEHPGSAPAALHEQSTPAPSPAPTKQHSRAPEALKGAPTSAQPPALPPVPASTPSKPRGLLDW